MGNIKIGMIIAAKRKERGVTQEELAQHLGVSKPAVSKWESGQSYPDIVLLPLLASYFDISVDSLIGYEPQMTLEEVRKLYRRLAEAFAKKPFDEVYQEIEQYLKKYFSCWQLQVQLGLLLLNHLTLAGSPDKSLQITKEVQEMFHRVSKSSEDVNTAKQALQLEALAYLCMNEPVPAIDILEDMKESLLSTESLLIRAYQMKGDTKNAIEHIQGVTYVNLMNMLGNCPNLFSAYSDRPDRMDYYYNKFVELIQVFDVENLHPASLLTAFYSAAQIFIMQDRKDRALDALENYLSIAVQMDKKGFVLKGNEYFDALEDYLADIDIETSAPRSSEVIWKDIKNIIISNPALAALEGEERFQKIKKKIEFEL